MRLHPRWFVIFVAGVLFAVPKAGAQGTSSEAWSPPEPSTNERDWIRMNSGEWLNGEIQSLRDGDLEFDSEELEDLELDWDDIAELRSARILTYRFEEIGVFTGTAVMKDGIVAIRTPAKVVEYPRDELLVIIEGEPRELNYWSGKGTVGVVARSGNTDQYDFTATARLQREAARSITLLRYRGNTGEVDDVKTTNNHRFDGSYNVLIQAGFFVTPISLDYLHDPIRNIDHRYVIGSALGYYLRRIDDLDWYVVLGAAYVETDYGSVEAGSASSLEQASVAFETEYDWDVSSEIEFTFNYQATVGVPEVKESYHTATALLSVDLYFDDVTLDVAFTWDRVETPQPDADGNVPERDDLRLSVGLGVEF